MSPDIGTSLEKLYGFTRTKQIGGRLFQNIAFETAIQLLPFGRYSDYMNLSRAPGMCDHVQRILDHAILYIGMALWTWAPFTNMDQL